MSTALRVRIAYALLLVGAFGLAVLAVTRQRDDAAARQAEERWTEALFDRIAVGDPDTRVDELAEFKGEVVRPDGWPAVVGELEGCETGCDIYPSFPGLPPRVRLDPREKITWVAWEFPRSERWIAVAIRGERYLRGSKSAIVVARRKNF